jgi:hypothetical protein
MSNYRLKGASGKVAGLSHPLGAVTRIGSASDCDLVIDEPRVPDLLAEISVQADGGLRLLKQNGGGEILLNGEPVSDVRLSSGDEIRIGAARWVLQAPGLRPEKVLTAKAVKRSSGIWPWLVAAAVLGAAAALAWQRGWLV